MLGHWGLGWGKFLSIPLSPPCVPKIPTSGILDAAQMHCSSLHLAISRFCC